MSKPGDRHKAKKHRCRDLARWREQTRTEPEEDFADEFCIDCGSYLVSGGYVSESGDGYFCGSCVRRHDDAEHEYEDYDDWDDDDCCSSMMLSGDPRLDQEKNHGFDAEGYERREALHAISECPQCGNEIECWAETDQWTEGDDGKWHHSGYGGAHGVCETCSVLVADCLSDGFQAFDLKQKN